MVRRFVACGLLGWLLYVPVRGQVASGGALRLFGSGTGFTDRVVIPLDDNAPGPDASRPGDVGAGSFTLEFWVLGATNDNAAPAVAAGSANDFNWISGNIIADRDIWVEGGGDDANRDWGVSFRGGRVSFGTGSAGADSDNTLTGATNVLNGRWRHVAVVRDAATGRKLIYVDGILDRQTTNAISTADLSFPNDGFATNNSPFNAFLVLGAEKHDADPVNYPSFAGWLDEVRLWNTALSAGTITQLFNQVVAPSQHSNLVGYWRFEESGGTNIIDSAWGGGTPGTLRGNAPGSGERVTHAGSYSNTAPVVWQLTNFGPLTTRLIATNLSRPVFVTSPPGDTNRIFIGEQHTGQIRIYDRSTSNVLATPYLTVGGLSTGGEQGLLGLAFHPGWATNPVFFVDFTTNSGSTIIRKYAASSATANVALATSGTNLLTVAQPFSNHNGGWLGFGPLDGFLYIALGDGGSGGDPGDRALDITGQLLGKMLRIDVNGDDFPADPERNYAIPPSNPFVGYPGDDEIWAYGLRNPWRNCFDPANGDLWIADVGQNTQEEINHLPRNPGPSTNGINFGWRMFEGTVVTTALSSNGTYTNNARFPLITHPHLGTTNGAFSITGGFVYRGPAMPWFQGTYIYGDYVLSNIWSLVRAGTGYVAYIGRMGELPALAFRNSLSSFGEDAQGELYATYYTNAVNGAARVYQITQAPWWLWRNRHFTPFELHDPAVGGPSADPDGDGRSNFDEFGFGGSPLVPDAPTFARSEGITVVSNLPYFAMNVQKNPDASDVLYTVEATSDLGLAGGWTTNGLITLTNTASQLTVRDAFPMTNGARRYFRARVTRP